MTGSAAHPLADIVGPYRLLGQIGSGGMAEVYLAEAVGSDGSCRRLAVKRLKSKWAEDEQFIQMLIDEARVAIRLDHENIVRAFELGCVGRTYFFSMEYVEGIDLLRLLQTLAERRQALPVEAALYIGQQLLCGLEYAHRLCDEEGQPLGLVHRDISPPNVLLSRGGEVKIADFGLARATQLPRRTVDGVIKGKLAYMSPEQACGRSIDARSDVFSAGAVLFETLTNKPLYGDISRQALFRAVREPSIPSPSSWRHDLPADIDAMLLPAVAPDPEQRYQSAGAFENAVRVTLRALSPAFGAEDLGRVLRSVLAGRPPSAPECDDAPESAGAGALPLLMRREHFLLGQHSIIAQVPTDVGPEPFVQVPTVVDLRVESSAEVLARCGKTLPPPAPAAGASVAAGMASGAQAGVIQQDPAPVAQWRDMETVTDEPDAGLAASGAAATPRRAAIGAASQAAASTTGGRAPALGPSAPTLLLDRSRPSTEPVEQVAPPVAWHQPRERHRLVAVVIAAAAGLLVGLGAMWTWSSLRRGDPIAAGERARELEVGRPLAVGRWQVQLERASKLGTASSEQLLLRLRLQRDGRPAREAGRLFFLQRPGGDYVAPVEVPSAEDPAVVSLSFRLDEGARDPAQGFHIRFAAPDSASVLLRPSILEAR